jgi:heat shock protein HtpX
MTRFVNNVKTAVLLGGLMGLFLVVGSLYGQSGLLIGLIAGGLTNVIAWFFSDKIALAAMRAQEVDASTPGVGGELYRLVDELRQRAGMPMPRVCICPQEAPNAFATGRSPSKAAVAVTQGALRLLNEAELRGVIGHELAHIKNRDTLISSIAATFAGAVSMLADMVMWSMIFGGFGGSEEEDDGGGMAGMAGGLLTMILAPISALLIQMAISRSREYTADATGAQILGNPLPLATALEKLEAMVHQRPMDVRPATSHLYIVNPILGGLGSLFRTHPETAKRVARLRELAGTTVADRNAYAAMRG